MLLRRKRVAKTVFIGVVFCVFFSGYMKAETSWASFTWDNDVFVGEDNGYTNGLYFSVYDVYTEDTGIKAPSFWLTPLLWSLPEYAPHSVLHAHSYGQSMVTPSDISLVNPPENSLPYSALLSYTNSYIAVTNYYADILSTTVGVIGPVALGERTQKRIHEVVGAQAPMGWDTQLDNELVFEFSRGRVWRAWASESEKKDVLIASRASLGTIRSSIRSGIMFRYGSSLDKSYVSILLSDSRSSNPVPISKGWFVYGGMVIGYVFNQIFADGNTFTDSRSIDYDHHNNAFILGAAYSWGDSALSFAVNAPFYFNKNNEDVELENMSSYGTLTYAWAF